MKKRKERQNREHNHVNGMTNNTTKLRNRIILSSKYSFLGHNSLSYQWNSNICNCSSMRIVSETKEND